MLLKSSPEIVSVLPYFFSINFFDLFAISVFPEPEKPVIQNTFPFFNLFFFHLIKI